MNKQELIKKAVETFPVWPDGATHIITTSIDWDGDNCYKGEFISVKKTESDSSSFIEDHSIADKHWQIACTREQHIRKRIELFECASKNQTHADIDNLGDFYRYDGFAYYAKNGAVRAANFDDLIPRPTPEEIDYIAEIDSSIKEKQFIREDRYLVIKRSDIDNILLDGEKEQLYRIAETINKGRTAPDCLNKPPLETVVIESDWPEYEKVWSMLEQRCKNPHQFQSASDDSEFRPFESEVETKKPFKLKAGNHVSTKGMTEDQYHTVCKAFIDAGAEIGEYRYGYEYEYVIWSDWEYVGWCYRDGIYHSNYNSRYWIDKYGTCADETYELTVDQVLSVVSDVDDTNEFEWMPEFNKKCLCYPRGGSECFEVTLVAIDGEYFIFKNHVGDLSRHSYFATDKLDTFRPLKTEAEKERLMEIGKKQIESCLMVHDDPHDYFECLGVLIDAGWRP